MHINREAPRRPPGTSAARVSETLEGTLPVKGLRYMASPALPAPTQKAAASLMATQNPLNATGPGASFTGGFTGTFGRLQPLGTTATKTISDRADTGLTTVSGALESAGATVTTRATMESSNFFAETLSRIGPSARRLLMLDAAASAGEECCEAEAGEPVSEPQRQGTQKGSIKGKPSAVGLRERRRLKGGDRDTAISKTERAHASTMPTGRTALSATLDGTLTRTLASSCGGARAKQTAVHAVNGINGTSLMRDPSVEPPLVGSLRCYLERELYLAKAGAPSASALDQLGPYREVFGALISAFPGYAALLSDVKAAYETVVQLQAELLTEAYAAEQRRVESIADHRAELRAVLARADELDQQLRDTRAEMEQREAANAESRTARRHLTSAGARADNFELRRQLERANGRIEQLEQGSKGDLEKILLLISAVRESDKRVKELEGSLDAMSGQVEELDEFKRLAGEAQGELQRYKEKFRAYVPADDFEAMKEHLVTELAAAQAMVKRLRRTAAVRGTQLDVLQRRMVLLEHEAEQLRHAAGGSSLSDGRDRAGDAELGSAPLTPRPDWAALESALPVLSDEAKAVHALPLPSNAFATGMGGGASAGGGTALTALPKPPAMDTAADAAGPSTEVLMVRGPDRSAMRAEFLVDQVRALGERVVSLERECEAARSRAAQAHADEVVAGARFKATGPVSAAGNSSIGHRRPSVARVPLTNPAAAVAVVGGTSNTAGLASGGTAPTSVAGSGIAAEGWHASSLQSGALSASAATGGGAVGTFRAPPMPLIGLGLSLDVPRHLRCVGFVRRTVVDTDVAVRLTFEFFARELAPILSEDATAELGLTAALDPPTRFHNFLFNVLAVGGLPQPAPGSLTAAPMSPRGGAAGSAGGDNGTLGGCSVAASFARLPTAPTNIPLSLPFCCAAHLAMNLEADAQDPRLTSPAALLNSFVLRGAMPARLAVEAASVVERIVADLNALAAEAQKPRLQRSAISECLAPVLELRTPEELADLRVALGTDATVDVLSLTTLKHRFLRTLFLQECQDNMTFYIRLIRAMTDKAESPAQLPPATRECCEEGDLLISIEAVAAALTEVEPLTPAIVVRELSENAIAHAEEEFRDGGALDGGDADAPATRRVVRLSEVIRALGDAPVIRRTRQAGSQGCTL